MKVTNTTLLPGLRAALLGGLLLAAAPAALAQTGVRIGTGTVAPDVSAALDIVSSTKGALLPRVASAAAIATPATGLLVYQTGAPAGFYYNAGTAGTPNWQQIATAAGAAFTADNGLTKTGQNIALGGTLTGATTIATGTNTLNITSAGTSNVLPLELSGGNVITDVTPLNSTESQLRLYRSGANNQSYGAAAELALGRYNSDVVTDAQFTQLDFKLGLGSNALADQKVMTLRGDGKVGIGTTTPDASAVLDVTSSSKGVLVPRMNQLQRDAIASPAAGLQIYNTTFNKLNVWNGTAWTQVLSDKEVPNTTTVNQTFTYTGGVQTYSVPANIFSLTVTANGAQGGTASGGTYTGGLGGRAQGTIAVTPGEVLSIYVGGQGNLGVPGSTVAGGYNGGGAGGFSGGGSGGGASDVRQGGTALTNRVVTGAGGGGAGIGGGPTGGGAAPANGGSGGGTTGGTGGRGGYNTTDPGTGGTGSAGGSLGGTLGVGGNAFSNPTSGGGGGGGYYGGGGCRTATRAGGGGGSSFASGGTYATGVNSGDGSVTITGSNTVTAAPVLDAANFVNFPNTATASNGLTKTGNDIALGGTLTGATTIAQSGNNFSLTGGNVGIGTSGPSALLHLSGGGMKIDAANTLEFGAGVSGKNVDAGKIGYQVFTADALDILGAGPTSTTRKIKFWNESGATFTGNVGIGTTPSARLTVQGVGSSFTDLTVNGRISTGDANGQGGVYLNQSGSQFVGQYPVGSTTMGLYNNGWNLVMNSAGNVGIGTAAPGFRLDLGSTYGSTSTDPVAKKLAVFNSTGSDFFGLGVSTGQLNFFAGAAPTAAAQMTLTNSGSVGIGTTAPAAALDVNGYLRVAGASTAPANGTVPSVAFLTLTATLPATQGAQILVPHGLTTAKIIGLQVLVEVGNGNTVPPESSDLAFELYHAYLNNGNVVLRPHSSNSGNVIGKPARILITYVP